MYFCCTYDVATTPGELQIVEDTALSLSVFRII